MVDPNLNVKELEVRLSEHKLDDRATGAYFLPHLSPDMRQPLLSIEALRLKPPITKHFRDLGVFLTALTEDKFSLVVIVLVLSTSPILSSLYCEVMLSVCRTTSYAN